MEKENKFTSRFFKFPYKNYLKKDVREYSANAETDPRWVQGLMCIPFEEIKAWGDDTLEDVEISDILDKGYDATYVQTYTAGVYEALWPIKTFERELNKAYSVYLQDNSLVMPKTITYTSIENGTTSY